MLRPAECVADRGSSLWPGRGRERMRNFMKKIWWNPADFFHHLRRVSRKMPLQFLEHALRMLQCEIALRTAQIAAFVKPTLAFIGALLFIPPREISVAIVLRITVFIGQNAGGVCVMDNVVAKEQFVFNQVIDESSEKYDVSTGANRYPNVRECTCAGKSWINVNDRRAVLLRFHYPAKTDWMRFGHRGTFDQNAICIRQILLSGRSSAPAERGAQTGHRAAMSYSGLVGHTDHAEASGE